jgi:hypothetical protein
MENIKSLILFLNLKNNYKNIIYCIIKWIKKSYKGDKRMYNQFRVHKKDDEGNRLEIRIWLDDRVNVLKIENVGIILKGKRKINYVISSDNRVFGEINSENLSQRKLEEILKFVSEEILMEALNEVWEELKPTKLIFK